MLLVFCFGLGLYAMKSSIAPAIMSELSSMGGEQREINMATWVPIKEYQDLRFERVEDGIAKITINRPEVRNAFRPQTIVELIEAFDLCRADTSIGSGKNCSPELEFGGHPLRHLLFECPALQTPCKRFAAAVSPL